MFGQITSKQKNSRFFSGKETSEFTFYYKKNDFFSLTFFHCIFFLVILFLLKKRHTYHGRFQSALWDFVKFQNAQLLQLQERIETQQVQLQERMEKLLIQAQKKIKKKKERNSWNINRNSWIINKNSWNINRKIKQKQLKYQKEMERETARILKNKFYHRQIGDILYKTNFLFRRTPIWSAIENFAYSPKEDVTFASYFWRYEVLYKTDCGNWSNSKKSRLLSKFCTTEHTKFENYILLRKTCELTFTEAVELQIEHFSPKTLLFHKRWKCLNQTRKEWENF